MKPPRRRPAWFRTEEPLPFASPQGGANSTQGERDPRASSVCFVLLTPDEAYRRYGRRILRRIRSRDVGPHSAEELLHDVYVVAIRMSRRQESLAHGLATLMAITRRLLRNYLRRRANRALPGWESDVAETADTAADDDAADARALVQAAFDRMKPADGELIRQVHGEGLPVDGIAQSLGCPVATVWTRLRRAKARLAMLLVQLDRDPPLDSSGTRRPVPGSAAVIAATRVGHVD